jgi:hypothetical protein
MPLATIAVGVPHRFVGDGWDPAPLLLAFAMLVLLRLARVPLGPRSLGAALVGGLLLDLVTDVFGVSPGTVVGALALPVAVVALARTPSR